LSDHPLSEIIKSVNEVIAKGGVTFQKFTCQGCGNRLTIEEPNKFYTSGTCDNCGTLTDIEKHGCNFVVIYGQRDAIDRAIKKITGSE
jgi:hypothetical protein